MATSITLGKFNKRVNSTKCAGFSGDTYDCLLKEPCSINNPVFQLKGSLGNYNYLKWSSRYYWVDDTISFPNGIIEVHAHMDPLATYQAAIKSGKGFFLYGGAAKWNKFVDDVRLQPEVPVEQNSTSIDVFGFTMTPTNGTVILTVFQCGASGDQGVCTYALSTSQFETCLKNLYNVLDDRIDSQTSSRNAIENLMPTITVSTDDAVKATIASNAVMGNKIEAFMCGIASDLAGLGNWRDNIIRAVYVPIPAATVQDYGSDETMYIGAINCGTQKRINPVIVETHSDTILIPWGPNVPTYPFLRTPRFQQLQVIAMGGYYQVIDGTPLTKEGSGGVVGLESDVYIKSSIDLCSGDWAISINKGNTADAIKLGTFSGNCGINITGYLGRGGSGFTMQSLNTIGRFFANTFTGGAVSGYLNAGEGYATTKNIGSGIECHFNGNGNYSLESGAVSGISGMFLSGNIGKADIASLIRLPQIIKDSNYIDYCNKYGYPCNKYCQFTDHWGSFAQASGISIECEGNQQAQSYINSVCNSGIYLED